jgi:hypothetical protein
VVVASPSADEYEAQAAKESTPIIMAIGRSFDDGVDIRGSSLELNG